MIERFIKAARARREKRRARLTEHITLGRTLVKQTKRQASSEVHAWREILNNPQVLDVVDVHDVKNKSQHKAGRPLYIV